MRTGSGGPAALLAAAALAALVGVAQGVVQVETGIAWSLLAWGWNSGGKDSTDGSALVIVDLDDHKDAIAGYKAAGLKVICYISTGTLEPWREDCKDDEEAWMAAAVGEMDSWNEEWLDITKVDALAELMLPRFERAKAYGCDGIEPDNTDCYDNSDCYGKISSLSTVAQAKAAQYTYNLWQVNAAHNLGLAIGLKNSLALVDDMADVYDFAVNEQCQQYNECGQLAPFAAQNKGILNVEYRTASDTCTEASSYSMSTKYCSGSGGVCTSGSWKNCFDEVDVTPSPGASPTPSGSTPTVASSPTPRPSPIPTAAPTFYQVWFPEAPAAWANLAFGFSDMDDRIVEAAEMAASENGVTSRRRALATAAVNASTPTYENITGAQVVLMSLHDTSGPNRAEVDYLIARGHHAICTFSAGALETWRPDYQANPSAWEAVLAENDATNRRGDLWLNMTDPALRPLIAARIDTAAEIGCHGVLPLDTDCLEHSSCRSNLGVDSITNRASAEDFQIDLNTYIAEYASSKELLVGLYSAHSIAKDLEPVFDFGFAEACVSRGLCSKYDVFLDNGKSVMSQEYQLSTSECDTYMSSSIAVKSCEGSVSKRLCDNASNYSNCFAAVTVTPWPTASPADADEDSVDVLMLAAFLCVAMVTLSGMAAVAFVVWRRRRASQGSGSKQASQFAPQASAANQGLRPGEVVVDVPVRRSWFRSSTSRAPEMAMAPAAAAAVSPGVGGPGGSGSYSRWLRETAQGAYSGPGNGGPEQTQYQAWSPWGGPPPSQQQRMSGNPLGPRGT
ncbi:Hypothetical Protein FCC1311_078002 [Hondaea fermentalgiana]|uniref:Glycoside-hydrolase family GH114 TIM-barrel domain-containing protein n=1 Tax=Hondaea fermentalgiana TaxID=2315210 RepID=A0A2R5GKZ5_9STRA|nr:Hypothetical Protein FCC1311_078002 [Hondaea fermentalgiana]|eukprot:GBG31576.1 Hypothetical Protein FCC1311_078002 [Hondaea fermentalgiana]